MEWSVITGRTRYVELDPKSHLLLLQCFKTFGHHYGFLIHQRINKGNKQIMDNTYDKSEMNTLQIQRIVAPKKLLGCRTTPLGYRSKGKPPVEPRMIKQQTRLSPAPTNSNKMFGITESDARPMYAQLKRVAKL